MNAYAYDTKEMWTIDLNVFQTKSMEQWRHLMSMTSLMALFYPICIQF